MDLQSQVIPDITLDKLEELSGPQLAALYNELTGKTIKKFRDRKTGIAKVRPVVQAAIEKMMADELARKKNVAPERLGQHRRRKFFNFRFTGRVRNYRENSKRGSLIQLLSRPQGATFSECKELTHWKYKVCYENIWLLHFFVGFGLWEKPEDRVIHLIDRQGPHPVLDNPEYKGKVFDPNTLPPPPYAAS